MRDPNLNHLNRVFMLELARTNGDHRAAILQVIREDRATYEDDVDRRIKLLSSQIERLQQKLDRVREAKAPLPAKVDATAVHVVVHRQCHACTAKAAGEAPLLVAQVIRAVAEAFGLKPDAITTRTKITKVNHARWVAAAILRCAGLSLSKVATWLGYSDHSTLSWALGERIHQPDLAPYKAVAVRFIARFVSDVAARRFAATEAPVDTMPRLLSVPRSAA